MLAQVGDIVLVIVDPALNNGSDVAPGVLTRINGVGGNGDWGPYQSVNAKAFLDANGADQHLASAYLYSSEDAARACLTAKPGVRTLFPKTAEVR